MPSLIQLSRAKFAEAKFFFVLHTVCQFAVLACGLVGIWNLSDKHAVLLAIAALILESAAWFFNYTGKRRYSLAEESKMAALQMDALAQPLPSFEHTDLLKRLGQSTMQRAEREDDRQYYSSRERGGLGRLRDHLQESSFWSADLFMISAWCALGIFFVVLAIVLLLSLSMLPLLPQHSLSISRIFITVLMSLVALDYLGRASDWFAASRQAREIDRSLESAIFSTAQDALPSFADYAVATASVRPIPSLIYRWRKPFLDRLWAQRKGYNL